MSLLEEKSGIFYNFPTLSFSRQTCTPHHDQAFIREILLFQLWNYKKGQPQHGNIWKSIASSLNQIQSIYFNVDDRAVRDRIKVMEKNYTKKKNDLERASGAEVEPEGEVETGVSEIIQLFKESDLRQAEDPE